MSQTSYQTAPSRHVPALAGSRHGDAHFIVRGGTFLGREMIRAGFEPAYVLSTGSYASFRWHSWMPFPLFYEELDY